MLQAFDLQSFPNNARTSAANLGAEKRIRCCRDASFLAPHIWLSFSSDAAGSGGFNRQCADRCPTAGSISGLWRLNMRHNAGSARCCSTHRISASLRCVRCSDARRGFSADHPVRLRAARLKQPSSCVVEPVSIGDHGDNRLIRLSLVGDTY